MPRKRPLNVFMIPLTKREARGVAAALKRWGYNKATFEDCYGKSSIEIASFFEPYDVEARTKLVGNVGRAAGLQPKKPNPERMVTDGQQT